MPSGLSRLSGRAFLKERFQPGNSSDCWGSGLQLYTASYPSHFQLHILSEILRGERQTELARRDIPSFGVISMALFSVVAITSVPSIYESLGYARWRKFQHLATGGFSRPRAMSLRWESKDGLIRRGWPGGLLPISLIAFIIVLGALLLRGMSLLFSERN